MTGSTTTLSLSLAVILLSIAQLLTFYHHVQDGHFTSLFPTTTSSTPIIVDQAQQVLHSIMLGLSSSPTTDFAASTTTKTTTAHEKVNTKMAVRRRNEQNKEDNNSPDVLGHSKIVASNNGHSNANTTNAAGANEKIDDDENKSRRRAPPQPPGPDSCSCWNPSYTCNQVHNKTCWRESEKCCHRTLHVNHKMGNILLKGLMGGQVLTGVKVELFPPHYHDKHYFHPGAGRYQRRAVLVHRNLEDSIVSGYLFHKAGQECWLDGFGNKVKGTNGGTMHDIPWVELMSKQRGYDIDFPWNRTEPAVPASKRDICEYLAQESEEVGMAAFADFALGFWFAINYEFWKLSKRKEDPENPTTLFVCYETLASPDTKQRTVNEIMDWLHPAGGYVSRAVPPKQKKRQYDGGHSTNPDPELRGRLKAILRRLDRDVFGHYIARTDEAFGCGLQKEQAQR